MQLNHEVTVYDLIDQKRLDCINVKGSLSDMKCLVSAMRGQDVVCHLAGQASTRNSPKLMEQNLGGTTHVLEAMCMERVSRIIFSSSSAVYGNTQTFPTPEDCPLPVQTTLYGASKVAGEALIAAYAFQHGVTATILRFAPVLGEGYRRGHLWDFWIKLIENQERIEILGDGEQRRSYVYVGDVVDALVLTGSLEQSKPVEIYNVGHGQTCSVNDSLDWLCSELGIRPERIYLGTSWNGDKPMTLLSTARLRALGWYPKVSIRDAVLRTVRSFEA